MKSIRITFRLSPYQLARGLEIIRQLEPEYKLFSTNAIVKTIYFDYLSKMTMNKSSEIDPDLVAEVIAHKSQPAQEKSITLDDLISIDASTEPDPQPIKEIDPEIHQKNLDAFNNFNKKHEAIENAPNEASETLESSETTEPQKASDFDDPNNTESSISSVTDFSPPKNWMD